MGKSPIFFGGESRAKQSFAQECDLNFVMRRYRQTGVLPVIAKVGKIGDFSSVEDFFESMLVVKRAEDQLASLPAAVRARFRNAPEELLAFVSDRKNFREAKELGLLSEEAVEEVEEVELPPASGASVASVK